MTVTLTDGDGDQVTSTVTDISGQISFLDDGPTAPTVTVSAATVGVDETPGVQTTGGASDVAGSTAITFNGGATTVAALFSGIANKGVDPDVSGGLKDNGALSFASSGASSIVSVGTATFGADGPAASGSETFNLSLLKTTSNLTLTDGEAITLSQSGNMILGTVTGGGAFSGQVAYAITIDPLTGQVYVADYLSLHQDSLTSTPNDGLALTSGTLGVTVTLTDGDGDQVTSTVTDISGQISFFDDGPTAPTVTVSSATVGVDETPGVQTTGGASDVAGLDRDQLQRGPDHGCGVVHWHCQQGRRSGCFRCFAGQWRAELCLERGEQHRIGGHADLWRGRPGSERSRDVRADGDQRGVWPAVDGRHGDHAVVGRQRAGDRDGGR